jgi:DNA topoisomerase-1
MYSETSTSLLADCTLTPEVALAVEAGGLRYVVDTLPGIARRPARGGFRYLDTAGEPVRDPKELTRIRALAIPPAWRDVWICPYADGHLQATGRDARGRKQYRYHRQWQAVRDEAKYERMIGFGHWLPAIRERLEADIRRPGLSRDKVLATIIRLLDVTQIRIGNEEYAQANKSYGLTTLRNRHVSIDGAVIEFHFRGKGGIAHNIKVSEPRLARIVRRMRELPGQELFQYVDAEEKRHSVGSTDVNDYLRAISGENYTAKDFRTWAGTVQAWAALQQLGPAANATEAKNNVRLAIEAAAQKLGNTPAICRKCYIHPAVLAAYMDGSMFGLRAKAIAGLSMEEAATLVLLETEISSITGTK